MSGRNSQFAPYAPVTPARGYSLSNVSLPSSVAAQTPSGSQFTQQPSSNRSSMSVASRVMSAAGPSSNMYRSAQSQQLQQHQHQHQQQHHSQRTAVARSMSSTRQQYHHEPTVANVGRPNSVPVSLFDANAYKHWFQIQHATEAKFDWDRYDKYIQSGRNVPSLDDMCAHSPLHALMGADRQMNELPEYKERILTQSTNQHKSTQNILFPAHSCAITFKEFCTTADRTQDHVVILNGTSILRSAVSTANNVTQNMKDIPFWDVTQLSKLLMSGNRAAAASDIFGSFFTHLIDIEGGCSLPVNTRLVLSLVHEDHTEMHNGRLKLKDHAIHIPFDIGMDPDAQPDTTIVQTPLARKPSSYAVFRDDYSETVEFELYAHVNPNEVQTLNPQRQETVENTVIQNWPMSSIVGREIARSHALLIASDIAALRAFQRRLNMIDMRAWINDVHSVKLQASDIKRKMTVQYESLRQGWLSVLRTTIPTVNMLTDNAGASDEDDDYNDEDDDNVEQDDDNEDNGGNGGVLSVRNASNYKRSSVLYWDDVKQILVDHVDNPSETFNDGTMERDRYSVYSWHHKYQIKEMAIFFSWLNKNGIDSSFTNPTPQHWFPPLPEDPPISSEKSRLYKLADEKKPFSPTNPYVVCVDASVAENTKADLTSAIKRINPVDYRRYHVVARILPADTRLRSWSDVWSSIMLAIDGNASHASGLIDISSQDAQTPTRSTMGMAFGVGSDPKSSSSSRSMTQASVPQKSSSTNNSVIDRIGSKMVNVQLKATFNIIPIKHSV